MTETMEAAGQQGAALSTLGFSRPSDRMGMMNRFRIGWRLAACLLGLSSAFVSAQETPSGGSSVDLSALADELQSTVERLRGVEFKTDVRKGIKTKAELIEFLESQIEKEYGGGKLERLSRFYQKVGLFPVGIDFKKILMNLLEEQVGGFYDPETEALYLMKEFIGSESVMKILLVHEMTHALDDQYHDLAGMIQLEGANDDVLFARGSIVEGNATWVMNQYTLSGALDPADLLAAAQSEMVKMDAVAAAPLFLVRGLMDRYTHGERFIREVVAKGDVESVEELFENPPLSSEQVYHPAKYARERDLPVTIELADFQAVLGEGWTRLEENTMGEFGTAVLFQEFSRNRSRTDPSALMAALTGSPTNLYAAGWDGDRIIAFHHEATDKVVFFWLGVWDSEDDAAEFFRGYRRKIFSKKYESPEIVQEIENGFLLATAAGGEGIVMEKRGTRTLIAEGMPFELAGKLRQKAWESRFDEGEPVVRQKVDGGSGRIAAAPVDDATPTPEAMLDTANQFRDEASSFEFSLPGTGWEFVTLPEPQVKVCAQRSDVGVRATVIVVPLEGQANLQATSQHTLATLQSKLGDVQVISHAETTFVDLPARRLILTANDPEAETRVQVRTTFVQSGSRFYTLTIRAPFGDEAAKTIGEAIENTFRLLEKP